ncbi:MarR family winged helix-turn-helix transcriptional regulator [Galbitalea soli]|uniref:MarR family transcriptional regulator n=1 Tax=Galbitalea soli TaxID=1268042 RepID=A0A7C9TS40_9MICO|nr:MarR family transcriptional regulator [Galbitalea soli]NEM92119.1 MarR family transcriptional regulator [Galbitalea soli]NYJ31929.1 DNA-binding MarR family transcriptional regulator [Galbitalea soli]
MGDATIAERGSDAAEATAAEPHSAPSHSAPSHSAPSFSALPLQPNELRYLVLAAQREGNRALARRLEPLGLTPSQAEILLVLADFGPLNLVELGRYIVCETGSPSRVVDALVGRGQVTRETSPSDRRAVDVALSEAGRALVPQLRAIEDEIDAATAGQLSETEAAWIAGVMRRFLAGTNSADALARRFHGVTG